MKMEREDLDVLIIENIRKLTSIISVNPPYIKHHCEKILEFCKQIDKLDKRGD